MYSLKMSSINRHCAVTFKRHCAITFKSHCAITFKKHCAIYYNQTILCYWNAIYQCISALSMKLVKRLASTYLCNCKIIILKILTVKILIIFVAFLLHFTFHIYKEYLWDKEKMSNVLFDPSQSHPGSYYCLPRQGYIARSEPIR